MAGTLRREQLDDGNVGLRGMKTGQHPELEDKELGSAWSFGDIHEGDSRHKKKAPSPLGV
jgi:hypothetical protein